MRQSFQEYINLLYDLNTSGKGALMKLNADIIFDSLKSQIPLEMHGPRSDEMLLEQPTFLVGNEKILPAKSLYCALADRLPLRPKIEKDVVIVCIGESHRLSYFKELCCVLHITERVDFFQVANLVHEVFERYKAWEDTLLEILAGTASIQEMIEQSYDIFENPLFVINSDFHVIATTGYDGTDVPYSAESAASDNVSLPTLTQFLELHELSMQVKEPLLLNLLDSSTLNTNLHKNDDYIGCLTVDYRFRRHSPSDIALARHLANRIIMALEKHSSGTGNARSVLKNALQDLIEGLPISLEQQRALEATKNKGFVCISMKLESRFAKLPPGYICNEFESRFLGGMAFIHNNSVVGFIEVERLPVDEESPCDTLRDKITAFIQSMDMRVGVSDVFNDLLDVRLFYKQASSVLESGELAYPNERYYAFQDMALTEMIINSVGELPLTMYFSEGLRRLAEHDVESEVSYLDTLRIYLNNNMSISKTAAALYIHRSTLLERIARIKRDLETDLRDPDERLRIQILLKAMQIAL
jgi:hypothetical protein